MFVKKLNVVKNIDESRLAEYERAGYKAVAETPKPEKKAKAETPKPE